jgi:hypothetical protein
MLSNAVTPKVLLELRVVLGVIRELRPFVGKHIATRQGLSGERSVWIVNFVLAEEAQS